MIGRLRGQLVSRQPPFLLLDVNGVGYEIEAPMSTFYELPETGAEVTLHTHLLVREDAHVLYGFHAEQETSATVRDLMTPMIFEVDENASIEEVADTMVKGHIHRLFVTHNKQIAGVVSALDMVEFLRNSYGKSAGLAREA